MAGMCKVCTIHAYGIGETYRLADFNLTPLWAGMGKKMIKPDTVSAVGQRTLRFSQYKKEIEGYDLNIKYPITTILQVSPQAVINRETLSATVSIHGLILKRIFRISNDCLISG